MTLFIFNKIKLGPFLPRVMLYELILINEIEQRAKIIFLSVLKAGSLLKSLTFSLSNSYSEACLSKQNNDRLNGTKGGCSFLLTLVFFGKNISTNYRQTDLGWDFTYTVNQCLEVILLKINRLVAS